LKHLGRIEERLENARPLDAEGGAVGYRKELCVKVPALAKIDRGGFGETSPSTGLLRGHAKITLPFLISKSRHLQPLLNREFLDVE